MAYKTLPHDDMTLFKNRLWKLMDSKGISTAKKLAKALYDGKYVTINQKDSFDDPDTIYYRAIDGVEKKIQRHLNSDSIQKLQGEYVKAYCDFFGCSADYLFGYIDLPTHTETDIYEKTGLSENAIKKICFHHSRSDFLGLIKSLNILLRLQSFENAIYYISKYLKTVKSTDTLYQERMKRYNEVFSNDPDITDKHACYNWPYCDSLDSNYEEAQKERDINEYYIDKYFKYVIQDLEELAKKEKHE